MKSQVFASCNTDLPLCSSALIRLEKTILKYEGAIFEILNAHASFRAHLIVSPQETPVAPAEAACAITDLGFTSSDKMSNPFRSSKKTTPERKATPIHPVFSDFPTAHSAITNLAQTMGEKIPSHSPGMPFEGDPYATLPSTIDIPKTPAKYIGGPAAEETKARISSSAPLEPYVSNEPERPVTPLLPPTPAMIRPTRLELSRRGRGRSLSHSSSEDQVPSGEFGKDDVELKVLKAPHQSTQDEDAEEGSIVPVCGPKSYQNLGNPLFRNAPPALGESSTIDSIVDKYNNADDRKSLRLREGSQRSVKMSTSPEVSSLSAEEDGMPLYQRSMAGRTPPLGKFMTLRTVRQPLTPGQPPSIPLPAVPDRVSVQGAKDLSFSESTSYDTTRNLLHIKSPARQDAVVGEPEQWQLIRRAAGMSTGDRMQHFARGGKLLFRNISDEELEEIRRLDREGLQPFIGEVETDFNESASFTDGFLRPAAYQPVSKKLKSDADKFSKDETGRMVLPFHIPADKREQPMNDAGPGGSQSSSSHGKTSDQSSFVEVGTSSSPFQHDKSLSCIDGNTPERPWSEEEYDAYRFGGVLPPSDNDDSDKDDGAVFDAEGKNSAGRDEDDDCDWETMRGSGLKNRSGPWSTTEREATESSLANMSSFGSLARGNPATAWGPLSIRAPAREHASIPKAQGGVAATLLPHNKTQEQPEAGHSVIPDFRPTNQPRFIPGARRDYQHPLTLSKEHEHTFTSPSIIQQSVLENSSSLTSSSVQQAADKVGESEEKYGEDTSAWQGLVTSQKRNNTSRPTTMSEVVAGKRRAFTTTVMEGQSEHSISSTDGSYSESLYSGPALSTSKIVRSSRYLPHRGGTFTKSTSLGEKGNMTGSFDSTGMRGLGSSEADYSTDSAMKSNKYEMLDDERTPERSRPATTEATAATINAKKVKFQKDQAMGTAMEKKVVLTKTGLPISEPMPFTIPNTYVQHVLSAHSSH